MELSPSSIQKFQAKILSWYTHNKRDLPWRKTRDPYAIFVSEVMSQQTQLSRVIPKYEAWLDKFPTLSDLAVSSKPDVLRMWSGLGYNRRGLRLREAAQMLEANYQGNFPRTVDELLKLPGVGLYTASAIACFAFDLQIPVVDTNIRKVITHEFSDGQLQSEKIIHEVALLILPKGKAYDWNQALMDYSASVLKGKKIPVPKQSHFLSSDRYYRGQIIKLLLNAKKMSMSGFYDYFLEHNPIDPLRLEEIIKKMMNENLIRKVKGRLLLVED